MVSPIEYLSIVTYEFCLVPYVKASLKDINTIIFQYFEEFKDVNNWSVTDILLKNIGKTAIAECFINIPYKSKSYYRTFFNLFQKDSFFKFSNKFNNDIPYIPYFY